MECDFQERLEVPHWTVQLPWLVAFFMFVVTGVLKFDQDYSQRFYDGDASEDLTLIDLNTATKAELETLPYIGPVLAQRMISARPFGDLEDLKRVPGIGPILLQRLLPKVRVKTER
jgi:DNA uptake protein ComE-like DNA-binding protein